ncbi:hypothetical protein Adt_11672 [Abeliophyllum distichum]|uniref:Uncharacterized protein n=1 Tax=Abeliophyllum distichum TaxID=126358 RepID=A0ABD1UNH8_9LAMI
MAYGAKVMISVEVGIPFPRHLHFNEATNEDLRRVNLDLQEERHANSQLCWWFIKGRWPGTTIPKSGAELSTSTTSPLKRFSWLIEKCGSEPWDPLGKDLIRSSRRFELEHTC